ncbi:MAG: transposase [Acetobacteraceae bacterium]
MQGNGSTICWPTYAGAVATALKDIYRATDDLAAAAALDAFEAGSWGRNIVQSWRRAWPEVIRSKPSPPTSGASSTPQIPSRRLNTKLRRAVRARGHFRTDEATMKLLFLVLHRAEKQWIISPREWTMAKAQFAIPCGERFAKGPRLIHEQASHTKSLIGPSNHHEAQHSKRLSLDALHRVLAEQGISPGSRQAPSS